MAEDISPFGKYFRSCEYVLALVGAGLSASSGIPTFTGDGASWRGYSTKSLATRSAFAQDPEFVWQFYEDRRNLALTAQPNAGHFALARLAKEVQHFFTITQNIDNLSQRAGHTPSKLAPLHGTLFTTKCFDQACAFSGSNVGDTGSTTPPRCPLCKSSFLRPGVVLFGEKLPVDTLKRTDEWLEAVPRVDLLLVIGTSARVFPAAEYIWKAREKGACIAHFNLERDDDLMCPGDWYIPGDAAQTLPPIVAEYLAPHV